MLERSQKFEKTMVRRCMTGPNALYLTEDLTDSMHLKKDMLILDLGCGRALSSVFLVKEYGVQVYAVDVQTRAAETYDMLKDIGMDKDVYPIQADAAALPIMPGMLDGFVCINAYHNFGMEDGQFFQKKIRPLLKDGSEVGLVLPATDSRFVDETDPQTNVQPAFWSIYNWKRWFEDDLDIKVCEQLTCTKEAWKEWIAVSGNVPIEDVEDTRISPKVALIKIVGTVK